MPSSSQPETQTIPARTGKAVFLPRGASIRIINTHGTQVVDFWAFQTQSTERKQQLTTFLSLPHTRASTCHLWPQVDDVLFTNHRLPLLQLTADTSPGIHDTLIAACDPQRYVELGVPAAEQHASCAMNLRQGLRDAGIPWPDESVLLRHWTPAPFNLFMNIPVGKGNGLSFEPTVARPGDFVQIKALVEDVVVVMSCCPQDRLPINGVGLEPKGVEFLVIEP